MSPAFLAKTAVSILTNEKSRKAVGWVAVAVLSPIILLLAFFCALFSGGVAMPPKMEPSTPQIRISGGIRLIREPVMRFFRGISASSSGLMAGPQSGWMWQTTIR